MESDLSRREFLERTALGGRDRGKRRAAGVDDPRRGRAGAHAGATRCPSPRNMPIDHFVILMMENRSFDHYFGWLPRRRRRAARDLPERDRPAASPTRHFSTLGTGGTQYKGCGHPDPGHGWDQGRAAAERRLPRPRLGQRRVRAHLLQPGRPRLHPRGGAQLHDLRPLLLLAARPDLAEPLLQVVGAVRRAEEQHDRARRQQLGDDLRPRDQPRPDGALLRLRPALRRPVRRPLGAPGSTRSRATTRTASPATCRTSRSSTRPSRTAAAATACRPTSTRSATCGSARRSWPTWSAPSSAHRNYERGALFVDLRRVGRVLRPRAPAARPRRPRQHRPRGGLRPDGLPRPGGGGLALRAQAKKRWPGSATTSAAPRSTSTTGSTPTSRSSSSSPTGSASATSTRA